jgi:hypothetical protein
MRKLTSMTGNPTVQVCRECEGGSKPCLCLRFESRGAIFDFPCRFALMSELVVGIETRAAGRGTGKLILDAIVIDCRQTGIGSFQTTVLFLPRSNARGPAGTDFVHLPN